MSLTTDRIVEVRSCPKCHNHLFPAGNHVKGEDKCPRCGLPIGWLNTWVAVALDGCYAEDTAVHPTVEDSETEVLKLKKRVADLAAAVSRWADTAAWVLAYGSVSVPGHIGQTFAVETQKLKDVAKASEEE